MESAVYYLAFSNCIGIGPMKFSLLMEHFHTAKKAYETSQAELVKPLGVSLTNAFLDFRNKFKPEEEIKKYEEAEITILTREDRRFPPQLLEISDPPICLYVKGNLAAYDFAKDQFIAVVGTRRPTSYGNYIAREFSEALAAAGFVIVSGMALGIDAVAHQAALDVQGGRTIAVLGCGVDLAQPPSNKNLYEQILKQDGLIISEFPMGMITQKGLFVARNRIVSGLSQGVLVAEGAEDSGALITARFAAEQGKEVFAPPAPITSEMAAAPNILLKQGAKLVTSVRDILEELDVSYVGRTIEDLNISEGEKRVVELLKGEAKLADDLSESLEISIGRVLQTLSSLEIAGIVEKNIEGKYQLVK